ncbi:hypothetical protein T12_16341 [Trichinella patagoniensis]|uniref:Uncharacterized protein n=1 Tax=Trichinella patagoniensis TaxID=990121 RepID=A0A0V0ZSS8_9BILA|nr:hypothetical protein T12_16341 [Trichinella patagoniensis]
MAQYSELHLVPNCGIWSNSVVWIKKALWVQCRRFGLLEDKLSPRFLTGR